MRVLTLLTTIVAAALSGCGGDSQSSGLRLATFQSDLTPPPGEPMVWDVPLKTVLSPLLAKGVILEDGQQRFVLCTIDWCELCNDSELSLRQKLAEAAQTTPDRVAIHVVHQHDAPYCDTGAYKYLDKTNPPMRRLSDAFLRDFADHLAAAVTAARKNMREFDHVGTSQAVVDRVASARRLKNPDGTITARYSTGATKPELAAAPEGDIDPYLKTITFASGEKPLVRLHFYASHPQTIQCDGRATADFVGWARQTMEKNEGVFQLYFTGCSGDVTVGKYNDGSDVAREALGQRMLAAMQSSTRQVHWQEIDHLNSRAVELCLPQSKKPDYSRDELLKRIAEPNGTPNSRIYLGAMRLSFLDRIDRPLIVRSLQLGDAIILSLPGEPMLEFQKFAQKLRPDRFIAVGGYCDVGPGYICTDASFSEGGYEPTATHAGIGSEARLKDAIRQALWADTK